MLRTSRITRDSVSVVSPNIFRSVAKYLEGHSVKSETDERVHMAKSGAHHLIRLAKENSADLIVTGAYSHSRLGEWIFGGMTQGLMDEGSFVS